MVDAVTTRKYKPYSAYKPSSVEWLGDIPEQWGTVPLKYVCYMKGRIGWQGLKHEEFADEGPYLITGMNFQNGNMDWESCYHITQERYDEAPEIHVKSGDVLITKDGTIGKLLFIGHLPGPTSLNSHLLLLRPLSYEFEPKYLYYLLKSDVFTRYVDNVKTGTTFYGITQEAVGDFRMLLFDKSEQLAIANFLDHQTAKLDALIAKKERLIELLEEKRTALISRAVTKGLNPDVDMKDSGVEWLGEIPAHWRVKRLKYIANESRAKLSTKPDYLRYIGLENVDSGTGKLLLDNEQEQVDSAVSMFEIGDVLFGKLRPYLAKGFYADFRGVCTGELLILKPKIIIIGKFLLLLLLSKTFIEVINSMTYGTKMPRVNWKHLGNMGFPLPDIEEQEEIIKYLDTQISKLDALKLTTSMTIEKLREYRTALISATVTGKIDVREWELS